WLLILAPEYPEETKCESLAAQVPSSASTVPDWWLGGVVPDQSRRCEPGLSGPPNQPLRRTPLVSDPFPQETEQLRGHYRNWSSHRTTYAQTRAPYSRYWPENRSLQRSAQKQPRAHYGEFLVTCVRSGRKSNASL